MRGLVVIVLVGWSVLAPAQARENPALTSPMPLSRLLTVCQDVKRYVALDDEIGTRPLTEADAKIISNAVTCLTATAMILDTVNVINRYYDDRFVCIDRFAKTSEIVNGFIDWIKTIDRNGGRDIFNVSAPHAFILHLREKYRC